MPGLMCPPAELLEMGLHTDILMNMTPRRTASPSDLIVQFPFL